MTIDIGDRKAAVRRALVRLADLCGDARGIAFGEADLVPASPLPNTVAELEAAGYVKVIAFLSDPHPYALTLAGWLAAQRASGRLESEQFNDRRGRLCAALKATVKGRDHEVILEWRELAELAGLSEGWVWNILKA